MVVIIVRFKGGNDWVRSLLLSRNSRVRGRPKSRANPCQIRDFLTSNIAIISPFFMDSENSLFYGVRKLLFMVSLNTKITTRRTPYISLWLYLLLAFTLSFSFSLSFSLALSLTLGLKLANRRFNN